MDRPQERRHRVGVSRSRHHQDLGICGRSTSPFSGQQSAGGEKKYEQRHGEQLDRYYDDVISQLVLPDALLIIGPGEAKLELKERLSRSKALSQCTVEIATAGRLTDPQIVAKVKEHFGIVR